MHSQIKLNKINQHLFGSRRQEKSYTDRYKQKGKIYQIPTAILQKHSQVQVTQLNNNTSLQIISTQTNIKIQQGDQYQIMKNQYMQTQLLWSKKISQTRHQIIQLKQNIKIQQKNIKQMQKELTNKRSRLAIIQQKLKGTQQIVNSIPIENYDGYINNLKEQYDNIDAIGQKQISSARKECQELQNQLDSLDTEIKQMQKDIENLSVYQLTAFNNTLNQYIFEEEVMKQQMEVIQKEMISIQMNINDKQVDRPIKEEVHRKYLQLYQKMFINKELDVMVGIISFKQEEIQRFQSYSKRKIVYRDCRGEVEQIQTRITKKKLLIKQLQEEIRQKSTILLNLYQMETLKLR